MSDKKSYRGKGRIAFQNVVPSGRTTNSGMYPVSEAILVFDAKDLLERASMDFHYSYANQDNHLLLQARGSSLQGTLTTPPPIPSHSIEGYSFRLPGERMLFWGTWNEQGAHYVWWAELEIEASEKDA